MYIYKRSKSVRADTVSPGLYRVVRNNYTHKLHVAGKVYHVTLG